MSQSKLITNFHIAGFQFYEGALALPNLKVGDRLQLEVEPENRYDEYAVAIYSDDYKLGYLPSEENRLIHLLLRHEKISNEDLYVVVQALDSSKHPYKQVFVGIFVSPTPKNLEEHVDNKPHKS